MGSLFAQPVMSMQNIPDPGDTLYYLTDELPDRLRLGSKGPRQFWNFNGLEAPYLQMMQVEEASAGVFYERYPSSDLVMIDQDGNEQYFALNGAQIDLLGGTHNFFKGNAHHFSFFKGGIPEMLSDLQFGDQRNFETTYECVLTRTEIPEYLVEHFDGIIQAVKIEADMSRSIAADAWGTLLVPLGQYDVLRLHVEDQIDAQVFARTEESAAWTPVEGQVAERLIGSQRKTHYSFHARDVAQPIATVFLDEEDRARSVTFRVHPSQIEYYRLANPRQKIYAFPNPAIASVRLKLTNLDPGTYTVRFYNILGKPLLDKQVEFDRPQTLRLDLSSFAKGTYLYTLIDERGKKLVTKRIVVLKP
ncbi:MAG: T9SS type A sorting domain-containing protein [Saprospiraceae bacterium]|nr:T9SS type A sorting domain-containing protein [Saprospiraceae bacterium]